MRAIHGGYFDDELHQYYDSNKRPVPGVTSILKSEGIIGDYDRPDGEFYMNRGTRIHKACEQFIKGTLSWGMLDDDIFGHVEQFEQFIKAHGKRLVITRCEEGNISPLFYGRTPDIEGMLDDKDVLIDIKSGPAQEWHCVQLAAYDFGHKPRQRSILELKTDDWKLVPTSKWGKPDAYYQDIWLSALNIYNFKRKK